MSEQAIVPVPSATTIARYRITRFRSRNNPMNIDQKLIIIQTYSGQEDLFQPHLVETAQIQDVDYVALSHCWGRKQIITTTKETLRSRLVAISWKELSKTFQDAIIITNNLGYRYLWVDSLCIIQNDHQDWELESKNMASIYQNSILTIAAGKSKDGDGGCFTSTTDLPGKEVLHPYTKSPTGIYYRRQLAHSLHHLQPLNHQTERSGDIDWPLCQRAWTFQEELLSTRLLYYGPEEIVWQCNTILCCQCGTINHSDANTDSIFQNKAYYASDMSSDQLLFTSARDYQRSLQIRWHKLVLGYSSRFLTRESDRVPALSGLAKQVQMAGLAPLVAGIPANNVHPWLLWKPLGTAAAAVWKRSTNYIAPSWSWLSYPSGHKLLFQDRWLSKISEGVDFVLEPIAQVLDITAEPAGLDPNGALKSGRLVLYSFASTHVVGTDDIYFIPNGYLRNLKLEAAKMDYEESLALFARRLEADRINKPEILCVLISRAQTTHGGKDRIFGLVLHTVGNLVYERIGSFECVANKSDIPWDDFKLQEITII
jgi:hypothetical protein